MVSKNESHISTLLKQISIPFKEQQRFSDLTSTGRPCDQLMFDFAIYNINNKIQYLIEYDGIQHFNYNTSGWNTKENYERTHRNDLLKNKYCFEHNIPIIRIPYNEEYTVDDLKLETTHFLLTPENEQEYYEKRTRKEANNGTR